MILALGFSSVYAQEYDDMYFSSKDRKQVKHVDESKAVSQDLNEVKQITQNPSENFSARTVNPEYIAKYQASSQENATAEFADDEYFVEDYNNTNELNGTVSEFQDQSRIAVRDRYGNVSYFRDYSDVYWSDPFLYEGTIFDPFYRPYNSFYRPYGFGYGSNMWLNGYSWSTPYTGWRFSFGVGYGWGNSWRYGSTWGYGNSWYNGFGYCPSYYGSYYGGYGFGYPYNNVVVINNFETRNNRTFRRGPGPSRSGNIDTNDGRRRSIATNNNTDGSVRNGRTATTGTSRSRYINNESRNFDDAQSKYYRRSRSAVNSSSTTDNNNGRSSYTTNSRSSSNYTPNSSNSRSSVNRSSSNTNSRSTYNSRPTNSRSNSSYSRPSNSRSRSNYTPNNRSSSNNRSSYNSSRSSSRSTGISSGSRSSSSRSSGSRSSSSGSSRRGNN